MKKLLILVLCLGLLSFLAAEDAKPVAAEAQADVSYSLGMLIGANLKGSGLTINPESFLAGLKDVINGAAPRYSSEQAQAAVQASLQAVQARKNQENLAAGKAFLAGNLKKTGVRATASGLQYEVLSLGTGLKPVAADTVTVNYEGKFINGSVFDSSIARNEPATFPLSGVIPAWTEGVQLMPVGSKYRFFVPSELAYGESGAGDAIEPNMVLIFEVELLSIDSGKE